MVGLIGSRVRVHCWPIRVISAVDKMTIGTKFLSPKYDVDAYMATLSGGRVGDLCWELGRTKSVDPILNACSKIFGVK